MITSLYTRLKRVKSKQNTYRHFKPKILSNSKNFDSSWNPQQKHSVDPFQEGRFGRRTGCGSSRNAMKKFLLGTKEAPIIQILWRKTYYSFFVICWSKIKFKMTMLVAHMDLRTSCNTSEAPILQGSAAYGLGATDIPAKKIVWEPLVYPIITFFLKY